MRPLAAISAHVVVDASAPVAFPRGWHACKDCGLAVPVRETWCTLCLFERQVIRKSDGWRCVGCGTLMTGKRTHARFCSRRCPGRYQARKVAAQQARATTTGPPI